MKRPADTTIPIFWDWIGVAWYGRKLQQNYERRMFSLIMIDS